MIYKNNLYRMKRKSNEIMPDQVGQNEFENSNEDQIMQEDDPDYSLVRDRSRSSRERNTREREKESKVIPKMKQSLEVQDLLGE